MLSTNELGWKVWIAKKNRNNGLSDFTFWSDSKFWDHQRLQKASSRLKKQHRCLIQGVKEDNQLNQQKLLLLPPSSDFPNNPPSTQTLIFFFNYSKIAIVTNSREKKILYQMMKFFWKPSINNIDFCQEYFFGIQSVCRPGWGFWEIAILSDFANPDSPFWKINKIAWFDKKSSI